MFEGASWGVAGYYTSNVWNGESNAVRCPWGQQGFLSLVPGGGIEPPHPLGYRILNLALWVLARTDAQETQ
jgi:hypothetical protein